MADHVQRFTSAQAIQKATLDYFSLFLSEPTAEVASRLVKQLVTQVQSLTELCSSMPEDDVNGLVVEYLTKCLKSIDEHERDTLADIEQLLMGGDLSPVAAAGDEDDDSPTSGVVDEVTDEFGEHDFAAEDGDICSSDDEDLAIDQLRRPGGGGLDMEEEDDEDDSEYRDMFVEVPNSELGPSTDSDPPPPPELHLDPRSARVPPPPADAPPTSADTDSDADALSGEQKLSEHSPTDTAGDSDDDLIFDEATPITVVATPTKAEFARELANMEDDFEAFEAAAAQSRASPPVSSLATYASPPAADDASSPLKFPDLSTPVMPSRSVKFATPKTPPTQAAQDAAAGGDGAPVNRAPLNILKTPMPKSALEAAGFDADLLREKVGCSPFVPSMHKKRTSASPLGPAGQKDDAEASAASTTTSTGGSPSSSAFATLLDEAASPNHKKKMKTSHPPDAKVKVCDEGDSIAPKVAPEPSKLKRASSSGDALAITVAVEPLPLKNPDCFDLSKIKAIKRRPSRTFGMASASGDGSQSLLSPAHATKAKSQLQDLIEDAAVTGDDDVVGPAVQVKVEPSKPDTVREVTQLKDLLEDGASSSADKQEPAASVQPKAEAAKEAPSADAPVPVKAAKARPMRRIVRPRASTASEKMSPSPKNSVSKVVVETVKDQKPSKVGGAKSQSKGLAARRNLLGAPSAITDEETFVDGAKVEFTRNLRRTRARSRSLPDVQPMTAAGGGRRLGLGVNKDDAKLRFRGGLTRPKASVKSFSKKPKPVSSTRQGAAAAKRTAPTATTTTAPTTATTTASARIPTRTRARGQTTEAPARPSSSSAAGATATAKASGTKQLSKLSSRESKLSSRESKPSSRESKPSTRESSSLSKPSSRESKLASRDSTSLSKPSSRNSTKSSRDSTSLSKLSSRSATFRSKLSSRESTKASRDSGSRASQSPQGRQLRSGADSPFASPVRKPAAAMRKPPAINVAAASSPKTRKAAATAASAAAAAVPAIDVATASSPRTPKGGTARTPKATTPRGAKAAAVKTPKGAKGRNSPRVSLKGNRLKRISMPARRADTLPASPAAMASALRSKRSQTVAADTGVGTNRMSASPRLAPQTLSTEAAGAGANLRALPSPLASLRSRKHAKVPGRETQKKAAEGSSGDGKQQTRVTTQNSPTIKERKMMLRARMSPTLRAAQASGVRRPGSESPTKVARLSRRFTRSGANGGAGDGANDGGAPKSARGAHTRGKSVGASARARRTTVLLGGANDGTGAGATAGVRAPTGLAPGNQALEKMRPSTADSGAAAKNAKSKDKDLAEKKQRLIEQDKKKFEEMSAKIAQREKRAETILMEKRQAEKEKIMRMKQRQLEAAERRRRISCPPSKDAQPGANDDGDAPPPPAFAGAGAAGGVPRPATSASSRPHSQSVAATGPSSSKSAPSSIVDVATSKLLAKRQTRQRRAVLSSLPRARPQTAEPTSEKSEAAAGGGALEEFPRPQTAPSSDASLARMKTANLRRKTSASRRRSSASPSPVMTHRRAATVDAAAASSSSSGSGGHAAAGSASSGVSAAAVDPPKSSRDNKESSAARSTTDSVGGATASAASLADAEVRPRKSAAAEAAETPQSGLEAADVAGKPLPVPLSDNRREGEVAAPPTQGEVERKSADGPPASAPRSQPESESQARTEAESGAGGHSSSSGDSPHKQGAAEEEKPSLPEKEYKRALILTHEERFPSPPKQTYNYEEAMADADDEEAIFKPKRRLLR